MGPSGRQALSGQWLGLQEEAGTSRVSRWWRRQRGPGGAGACHWPYSAGPHVTCFRLRNIHHLATKRGGEGVGEGDMTSLPRAGWDVAEPLRAPVKDTSSATRANAPASCPQSVPWLDARASGAVMGDALSMGTVVLRGLIAAPSLRKVKTQREDMSVEGQTAVALGRTAPRIPQTAAQPCGSSGQRFWGGM